MYFFTSVTANYIPKARVLAHSVKRHNPGAVFYVVLSDELPPSIQLEDEPFDRILLIQELGLPVPNLEAWIFKHSVVELCTAVKGQAFLRLFEEPGADKVVYLDPDIAVFHAFDELESLLDRHDVILTPHLSDPNTVYDSILDHELSTLRHGIYNLGFLALRRGAEGLRVATWWRDRLLEFCYDDIPGGLFTDQKWMDMAPAFFDVHVLKDRTYNVATWNINHRPVTLDAAGKPFVHGRPLKFLHFSGFDSGAHDVMRDKYAQEGSGLHVLSAWYRGALEAQGQSLLGQTRCLYDTFSNGVPITQAQRVLYRNRPDLRQAFMHPSRVNADETCFLSWYRADEQQGQTPPAPLPSGVSRFKKLVPLSLKRAIKRLYARALRA